MVTANNLNPYKYRILWLETLHKSFGLHILSQFHCSYWRVDIHFERYGNQSFTIVLPGNAQRLTSCDNTLKSSITSFTDCTIPEWLFEVRLVQRLDGCQFGALAERRS